MSKERIPIAADHAGFEMKAKIEAVLKKLGYEVEDLGATSAASSDYPDFAHPLAQEVSDGEAKRGVICISRGFRQSLARAHARGSESQQGDDQCCP